MNDREVADVRYVQVQTTAGSSEEAGRLADALLTRRQAACVQVVGPIRSRYWWNGQLESAEEWLCLAKTTESCVESLTATVLEVHSYDTPEVIVLPILSGSESYLRWLAGEVHGP